MWRAAIPRNIEVKHKAKPPTSSPDQVRQLASSRPHPPHELGRDPGGLLAVDLVAEGRALEGPGAEVEGEGHQRVELPVRERHVDEPQHGPPLGHHDPL